MTRRVTLGLVLLSLVAVAEVRAEPFTILPDGSVAFNTALTTSGVFRCIGSAPCMGSGSGTNSITFGSGANQATITFTGVTTTYQATNRAQSIPIGTFTAVATPGFTFPERPNRNVPIVEFRLGFAHTSPTPGTGSTTLTFGPGGFATVPLLTGKSHATVPLGINPPGFGYTQYIYTVRPFPFRLPSNGSLDLTARVGVVPEPGTMVLLGSGLAGLIAARRRRRHSTTDVS